VFVDDIVSTLRKAPGCTVNSPAGIPETRTGHLLPSDLQRFYEICGGITLFEYSEFPYRILGPDQFLPSTIVILGENVEDEDLSLSWNTVAGDFNGDYVSIDLHPDRLGKCYDSFHETYAMVGQSPIVALLFTDLLERFITNQGRSIYWLDNEFRVIGDAHDK
jgi:hypothetical protein